MAFVAVAYGVGAGHLAGLDAAVISWLADLHHPFLTRIMLGITALGSAGILIPLGLVTAAWVWGTPPRLGPAQSRGHVRLGALTILVALSGSWVLNTLLKAIFQRARPELFPLASATGFAFPSGHAMTVTAFYSVTAYVASVTLATMRKSAAAPTLDPADGVAPAWHPHVLALVAALVTILVGASRVYLGVHFPSDVLGGFVAGISWALLCIAGYERLKHS